MLKNNRLITAILQRTPLTTLIPALDRRRISEVPFVGWSFGRKSPMLNCFKYQKKYFTFRIRSWIWLDISRWNLLSNNNQCCLSYTANTEAADALAPLGARASAGMVLTHRIWIIPSEELTYGNIPVLVILLLWWLKPHAICVAKYRCEIFWSL